MKKVLDNFLDILTICSEVVSSDGVPTNMEEDARDGYHWLMEELKDLPQTQFDYLRVRGSKRPAGVASGGAFKNSFDSLSVYAGTIYWLTHKKYSTRRERVAAKYVLDFIHQKRDQWIHHLTPYSTRKKHLSVVNLLVSAKRVRPLKYPSLKRYSKKRAH
ncbi:uncharacterized protein MELLADRAFT_73298 [Melampsora larici-populina 98AG31]|uniref:Uncharacterized protein n=1 Tax=Melampsora larici-populina (strain 98AG31 / pathotype 3-4-7) TaxID=747676 RepID=F4S635_MELLP|nr:uncharacterized protein MELLADRAFT_73298 [Melampsora larici-populina 98AG31]EGF99912.1 hypothetical protein MELLADRAFT_73298 [Melampsora larici-populina 98AG31]